MLLKGKKLLITGVLTPQSIAYAVAETAQKEGAELLLTGSLKPEKRLEMFQTASKGDFWQRFPAVVGAQMTDGLLRLVGREKFLAALAAGPRAVASLYVSATAGKGYPEFSKAVKKELESRPSAAAGKP